MAINLRYFGGGNTCISDQFRIYCGCLWEKVGNCGARRRYAGVLPLIGELEHMFFGRFYHNLDEKGRLTIPARYRDLLLPDGAYVMQGFDSNIMVLPSAVFESLSNNINQMSITDPTKRLLRRMVFSTANRVEFDRAGRILIPQFLRQGAGLDTTVVVVGAGLYFEIWSPEAWVHQDQQLQDAQANAQRFSGLELTSG